MRYGNVETDALGNVWEDDAQALSDDYRAGRCDHARWAAEDKAEGRALVAALLRISGHR